MKKYLKIIAVIVIAIIGLVAVYLFVIVPKQEADKLASAQKDAFLDCDNRWNKISSQLVTEQALQISNIGCAQRKLQQDKFNTNEENGNYPQSVKKALEDYTNFDFFVDSRVYCYDGKAQIHDRDSYMSYCEDWYLINVGSTPSFMDNSNIKLHYH
ncbi:MAG: hypothetical protein ABR875_00160 [Minisyncoccia bacterium]|jgi:hypothetical protein